MADHLWQSLLFSALACALAALARDRDPRLRPWLWRVATLKFLVPFALPYALGQWLGLPSRYSGNPVPPSLAAAEAMVTPWFSPVRSGVIPPDLTTGCLLAALVAAALCLRYLLGALRTDPERPLQSESRPLGLWRAFVIASAAFAVLWVPMLGGAIADRGWRYELLLEHQRALRDAPIDMREAAPGMGSRMRVIAHPDGVLIRNANLRELIAVSYGVTHYAVWTNQMYTRVDDARTSWWLAPRYDLRIRANIRAPGEFDSLALRELMTRFLVARFGIEINLNGKCQKPCGRWDPAAEVPLPVQ